MRFFRPRHCLPDMGQEYVSRRPNGVRIGYPYQGGVSRQISDEDTESA